MHDPLYENGITDDVQSLAVLITCWCISEQMNPKNLVVAHNVSVFIKCSSLLNNTNTAHQLTKDLQMICCLLQDFTEISYTGRKVKIITLHLETRLLKDKELKRRFRKNCTFTWPRRISRHVADNKTTTNKVNNRIPVDISGSFPLSTRRSYSCMTTRRRWCALVRCLC